MDLQQSLPTAVKKTILQVELHLEIMTLPGIAVDIMEEAEATPEITIEQTDVDIQ